MSRLPQVNAFLLCQTAFQQAHTGNWCIIGTYSAIMGPAFPLANAPMVVFLSLSDFDGDTRIEIQIRKPDAQLLNAVRAEIPRIPHPSAEFALPFPPLTFPEPGVYTLELHAGGDLLAARSLKVGVAQQPPQQPPQVPPPPGA